MPAVGAACAPPNVDTIMPPKYSTRCCCSRGWGCAGDTTTSSISSSVSSRFACASGCGGALPPISDSTTPAMTMRAGPRGLCCFKIPTRAAELRLRLCTTNITVAAMTASEHTRTAMSSTVCELVAAALDCESPVFAPLCEPPVPPETPVASTEPSTTGDGCAVGLADVAMRLSTQTPGATPSRRCWPLLHEMHDDAESNRHVAQEL